MPEETPRESSSGQSASNPFSTGGGGTVFENKVQSSLFTLLLVGAYAPIFESSLISELHLQTAAQGYATDDALLVATDSLHQHRKQLWSVKREVKFTESDEV